MDKGIKVIGTFTFEITVEENYCLVDTPMNVVLADIKATLGRNEVAETIYDFGITPSDINWSVTSCEVSDIEPSTSVKLTD